MRPEQENPRDFKNRLFYGAIVGAFLGMIIGTMPSNEPALALASMATGSVLIAALAVVSENFWESLRAAWELVRMAFWRW